MQQDQVTPAASRTKCEIRAILVLLQTVDRANRSLDVLFWLGLIDPVAECRRRDTLVWTTCSAILIRGSRELGRRYQRADCKAVVCDFNAENRDRLSNGLSLVSGRASPPIFAASVRIAPS